ncbi:MAG: phage/plasmid primase, P4 family [Oscillospiraceae bacterium]|nr:phage/plasmid primase, P4 family [Oscillospiraceae bacterium]
MFFKGYIKTSNKQAAEKFKGRTDFKTLEEVQSLSEYAGILAQDTILIDIDDSDRADKLMDIVEALQLNCKVIQTTRGKHFLFKNIKVRNCHTHKNLAIGLMADIKVGFTNSYEILKFNGEERFVEWDIENPETDNYQEVPKWLFPISYQMDFLNMDAGDGRNQALFNYILVLQSNDFTVDETRETIRIINKYILKEPLSDEELEVILRDDAFKKPVFFKGSTFLFDKFATYIKNNNHIIRINNQLHLYRDGIYVSGQTDIEAEMIKHIPQLNRSKRQEVMAYLDIMIRENTPSTDASMIAFRNGVYSIKDCSFIPLSPDMVITNRIDWDFNPQAYSQNTDQTLNKIACGDDQIRKLLEEAAGFCLFRRNELGKAFILTGTGSNGKSTYLNMLKNMLGKRNISSLDLKKLDDRFSTVMLFGKLANIGDDISDEFIMDASTFKKIVTGETIDAEQKGQPKFEFEPYVKLFFSANNIPRMGKGRDSAAILRRLIIIPFDAKFSNTDPDFDPHIGDILKSQESMEYMIQLGLAGLKRVLERNCFTESEKVGKEIDEYEESNNPVLGFIREVESDDDFQIENEPTRTVYKRYHEYCLANNLQPMSNIEFSKQINKILNFETKMQRIGKQTVKIFIKK